MARGLCRYGLVIVGKVYAMCTLPDLHNREVRSPTTRTFHNGHPLMDYRGRYVNAPYWCVHCGRPMGNFEGGSSIVRNSWVCHPNVSDRPDCYRLITVYNEVLGVRRDETQAVILGDREAQSFVQGTLMRSPTRVEWPV